MGQTDILSVSEASLMDKNVGTLMECKLLSEEDVEALCKKCKEILETEPNVTPVKCPVTIVGDVHGQYHDVMELFKIAGTAPDTNFYSWATTSIEATTRSRPFRSSLRSR